MKKKKKRKNLMKKKMLHITLMKKAKETPPKTENLMVLNSKIKQKVNTEKKKVKIIVITNT